MKNVNQSLNKLIKIKEKIKNRNKIIKICVVC